jgi:hypothetical protein
MGPEVTRNAAKGKSNYVDMRVLAAYCKVCISMLELVAAVSQLEPEAPSGSSVGPGADTGAMLPDTAVPARPVRASRGAGPAGRVASLALVPTARCEDPRRAPRSAQGLIVARARALTGNPYLWGFGALLLLLLLPRLMSALVARSFEALFLKSIRAFSTSIEVAFTVVTNIADQLTEELLSTPTAPSQEPGAPKAATPATPSWGTFLVGIVLGKHYLN